MLLTLFCELIDLMEVTEFLEALRLPGEETGEELLPRPQPEDVVALIINKEMVSIKYRSVKKDYNTF
jgi:hypothetical protein